MKKKFLNIPILVRTVQIFVVLTPLLDIGNTIIKIIALLLIAVISLPINYQLNKMISHKIKEGKIHIFGIDKTYEMYDKLFIIFGILFFIVTSYFSLDNEKIFNSLYGMFFIILIGLCNNKFIFPNLQWKLLIEDGKMYFPSIFKRSRKLNNQIEVTDSYGYTFKIKDGDWETEIPKVEGEDSRLKELIAQSGSLEIS